MSRAWQETPHQMPDGKRLPLPATALRRRCDPVTLGFQTTAELEPLHELMGQERALAAIAFGARIKQDGFNVFAMGPAHAGRHNAIKRFLESKASTEAIPDDWVFVNNFDSPDRPVAICLPSGIGNRLKAAMMELIDDLSSSIPSMFESEDYRNRRKAIDDELETAQETALETLHKNAQAQNIAILRTPMGFALARLVNGRVIKPEVFSALPAKEREKIESVIETLQQELELTLRNVPALEKERRKKIRKLKGDANEVPRGFRSSRCIDNVRVQHRPDQPLWTNERQWCILLNVYPTSSTRLQCCDRSFLDPDRMESC